jgi:hypothetical protein
MNNIVLDDSGLLLLGRDMWCLAVMHGVTKKVTRSRSSVLGFGDKGGTALRNVEKRNEVTSQKSRFLWNTAVRSSKFATFYLSFTNG